MDLDITQIADRLYVGAWPQREHAGELATLNVRLIISMLFFERMAVELSQPPFRLVRLRAFDHPLAPIPIQLLKRGVLEALPAMDGGASVLIHCKLGVHRSVAMASCVLIGMGRSADEAMRVVKERRPVADPHAWYIERRIRAFEKSWRRN